MRLGQALQPYALPYTGLRGVPYPAVRELLLAAGMIGSVGGVGDYDLKHIRPRLDDARHIEAERGVAAHMSAELLLVEVDGRKAVDGVEVQKGATLEKALVHVEFEAVAKHIVGLDLHALGEPRKQALRRIRHQNLALPAGEAVLAPEN